MPDERLEAMLDEAKEVVLKAVETIEGDRPFLRPETRVYIAVDLTFAIVIDRIEMTEEGYARRLTDQTDRSL